MRYLSPYRHEQKGAVAVIVGVTLAVLIGFAGLALDLGRLYINKTELQNAVDACALAAAPYLDCDPDVAGSCPANGSNLKKAENAGIFAAGKNFSDFQKNPVSVGNNLLTVSFSTEFVSGYAPPGTPNPASKYVKCTAESQGIVAWFMGVLGVEKASIVRAAAVATLGPGQTFCSSAPMGICANSPISPYGYSAGDWITLDVHINDKEDEVNIDPEQQDKTFRWIDFDPNEGGSDEVRDHLAGQDLECGLKTGDNVRETGAKQGVKSAYNTRFGLYKNDASGNEKQYSPTNAPPDKTGYAFPTNNKADPVVTVGEDAYDSYRTRQSSYSPFDEKEYDGNAWGKPADQGYEKNLNRRLIAVPMIACPGPGKDTPILDMACVLMLNPMNVGAGKQTLYLQFLGLTKDSTEPECQSTGLPGGNGPKVPMLVQ